MQPLVNKGKNQYLVARSLVGATKGVEAQRAASTSNSRSSPRPRARWSYNLPPAHDRASVMLMKTNRTAQWIHRMLTMTEVGMLLYWALAALMVLDMVTVPPAWMYSNYSDPMIVAWNWSFFPVDVLFTLTGLVSRLPSHRSRQGLAVFSTTLMFCAGLMAISFWTLRAEFDAFWWGTNIWLIILSLTALAQPLVMRNTPIASA